MKVLMKKVGGYKKGRMWNMASFQTRRWHREQAQAAKPSDTHKETCEAAQPILNPAPSSPSPLRGEGGGEVLSSSSSNPANSQSEPTNPPSEAPPALENLNSKIENLKSPSPPTEPLQQSPESVNPSDPPLPSPCSLFPPVKPPTRVGKIARLPHDLRETVNGMLRGGFRYRDIAAHLNDLGHPGITENNISFWRRHGYMDWLARQHELEARATLVKSFEHCTRALDTDRVQQNAIAFAAGQLCEAMAHFDHRNILRLLTQRPELFPKFVDSMATLSRCSNDLAKAFTANQKSDSIIRSEMKENPITQSLSEPISNADLDQDEEGQGTFEGAQTACACSNHSVEAPARPGTPMHSQPQCCDSKPSIEHPQSDNASALHPSSEIQTNPNNSKQIQPVTTNPGENLVPTDAEPHQTG